MKPERPCWELDRNGLHFAIDPDIELTGTLCGSDAAEDGRLEVLFLVNETGSYPIDLEAGFGPALTSRLGDTITVAGHFFEDRFGIEHLRVGNTRSAQD